MSHQKLKLKSYKKKESKNIFILNRLKRKVGQIN